MNVSTDRAAGIDIVRIGETRLIYPLLTAFAATVAPLLRDDAPKVVIDMSRVVYIDSASIGCLMDLYRQASQAGGTVKLAGVQRRVETMLTMTGVPKFIELHADDSSAVESFGE